MTELMIHLDANSKKPLYEQIYDYIRLHIADGKISCGEKLPSTRFLSKYLQISRSTVELAYAQLVSEGYLESKPACGYYVTDISGLYLGKNQEQKVSKPQEVKTYSIDFSPEENEYAYFPYNIWRKISKEILSANDPTLFTAGPSAGEWELRNAICHYLYHARGVNVNTEQIIVGAGNEYLLLLLAQILGSKKRAAMENPTYLKAYQTLFNMNYDIHLLNMDKNGIRMDELYLLNPDIVYTMPSHQFPTGIVMPMKRRMELLRWSAEKKNRYIIEDDHDSEFRYRGKPIPSLQSYDVNDTVIYLGTFSKSISPAIRVSYMALPKQLLKAYEIRCGFYASTVPKEQQRVLTVFLEQGYFERYLNKMRGIYKGKHDLFLSLLKREKWVDTIYGDYAGMHLLVKLHTEKPAAFVIDEAKKNGVRIYGLTEYMIPDSTYTKEEEKTLLLGYGGLSEEQMQKGIACVREVLNI